MTVRDNPALHRFEMDTEAGVAIVTYIAFVHVLRSPLPTGVLGYW